jgi:hypothetical protein
MVYVKLKNSVMEDKNNVAKIKKMKLWKKGNLTRKSIGIILATKFRFFVALSQKMYLTLQTSLGIFSRREPQIFY